MDCWNWPAVTVPGAVSVVGLVAVSFVVVSVVLVMDVVVMSMMVGVITISNGVDGNLSVGYMPDAHWTGMHMDQTSDGMQTSSSGACGDMVLNVRVVDVTGTVNVHDLDMVDDTVKAHGHDDVGNTVNTKTDLQIR